MFTIDYVNDILEDLFSGAYLGLSTTTPTAAGASFTEPASGTGYERAEASQGAFAAASKNVKNTKYIYFPEITSDAGTVTHMGVFSAKTAGKLRYFGALRTPKALTPASSEEGVVPLFRPEAISITIDDSEA